MSGVACILKTKDDAWHRMIIRLFNKQQPESFTHRNVTLTQDIELRKTEGTQRMMINRTDNRCGLIRKHENK